jgi:hypothetical protein
VLQCLQIINIQHNQQVHFVEETLIMLALLQSKIKECFQKMLKPEPGSF